MNISFMKEKWNKYVIYILLGVLLLIICIPTGPMTEQSVVASSNQENESLEYRLKRVLSVMEGVGEVEVMITTEGEEVSLFATETKTEKVSGVLVVAEGAGNATVEMRISEAIKALFSVDSHKISIVKMSSEEDD